MSEVKTTYIRPQEGFQEEFVRSNIDVVFGGGVLGSGKAETLNSLICTPFGFRKFGDLKVGDIVSNPDTGGQERIIQLHPIQTLEYFKVEFTDGTYVECSGEHLWKIRIAGKKTKRKDIEGERDDWRIWDTKMIMKFLDSKKEGKNSQRSVSVPLTEAVQFTRPITPTTPRPIEPYVLGALIGDGCFSQSIQNRVELCTPDSHIVEKFSYYGYDMSNFTQKQDGCAVYRIYSKELLEGLKILKLKDKVSNNKFIPDTYKFSTIQERKELIQGLMDTDGYVDSNGHLSYTTVSKQLAEDVAFLIRSIGGVASIGTKKAGYKDCDGVFHECQLAYNVYICTKDNRSIVTLPKKLCRIGDLGYKNGKKFYLERKIKSIESIGLKEGRCITVENPSGLYITNDFIVTHNSFGAVLSVAEPSDDGNFRGLFLRNNLGDLRSGGGLLDNFREAFGDYIEIVESGEPRVTFPSGARIDVTHVSDQTREKVLQRFKGRQYDFIYFDELTGFTFECFAAICTRNRGRGRWTGKIRATTNPMRNCWIREFIDWYIGADGFIREDRAGIVRYFYMSGETVKDVVWGDSKEEVYARCRIDIDRKLAKINGKTGTATYENLIKSFTFYLGKMTENKAMLSNNDDYVGSVAMMGGRNAQQLLEGNWNVDPEEDLEAIIPSEMAMQCFMNDPQANGDKWITCDLADTGTDNFIALAWDGFHIIDILIVGLSTPRQNAEMLHGFAVKHDIADDHIIYDAIRGTYINDYIRDAVQFVSYRAPMGMYGRGYVKLKDECYGRLVEAIKRGGLSFADELQNKRYEHARLDAFVSIENEFVEECSVVRYDITAGGKKTLWSKKKMNQKLGKNRSMDLLDPCAMRMLPVLEYAYGEELIKTSTFDVYTPEEYDGLGQPNVCNIFDDTMFC